MIRLQCDIQLGGSTAQYLSYNLRNSSKEQFIKGLEKSLSYRAKTKPFKMATRLAALIGLVYDEFNGDEYLLDVIITAFNNIKNKSLQ